ncbi:MAG: hypothetical protein ACPIOQ_44355, partial [Promethearchaeia archaeon]
ALRLGRPPATRSAAQESGPDASTRPLGAPAVLAAALLGSARAIRTALGAGSDSARLTARIRVR